MASETYERTLDRVLKSVYDQNRKGRPVTQPEDTSEADGLKTFFRQFWANRWDHGRTVIKTIRSQLRWAIQELRALKRKQK